MHAVGQGALGIECAEENNFILKFLEPLNHAATYIRCLAERSFMRTLEGGCSVPIAVFSSVQFSRNESVIDHSDEYKLNLKGSVWNLDGSKSVVKEKDCNIERDSRQDNKVGSADTLFKLTSVHFRQFSKFHTNAALIATQLGKNLGELLLDLGAKTILDEVKAEKDNNNKQ